MAKVAGFNLVLVVSVVVGVAALAATYQVEALGGVGGRLEVQNVQSNADVQHLGKYCVTEYNRGLNVKNNPQNASKKLSFSEVIKAEKQVVAGMKYYLRINAAGPDGQIKTFDAELVLKPRETVKELIAFAPATLN